MPATPGSTARSSPAPAGFPASCTGMASSPRRPPGPPPLLQRNVAGKPLTERRPAPSRHPSRQRTAHLERARHDNSADRQRQSASTRPDRIRAAAGRRSCSSASSICSWFGCSAGCCSSPETTPPRTWRSWYCGMKSRSCAAASPGRSRTGLTGPWSERSHDCCPGIFDSTGRQFLNSPLQAVCCAKALRRI
jgi:hypothetical protein